ncbi:complement regulator-acquiring protein (plasmid) [Borreliella andersonii]|uniref:Complement regulator-acquiring protein n=1 Tax=Borrelia andersonii TaxID=42109 RepID=A0ABZ0CN18_BORAD|nr:complement regulator-acquiring protein [Borreliella andersonii]WNY66383.1 complement regulator-acquiring protein [Borreliella andersonii]
MTKAKPNAIKLNIIAMILTLIYISCAPFSKIDPKVNENTKPETIISLETIISPEKTPKIL